MIFPLFRSLKFTLFFNYSVIILSVFILYSIIFSVNISDSIRNTTLAEIESRSLSIRNDIEREIQKMDMVSMNVLYSNLAKQNFAEYLHYTIQKRYGVEDDEAAKITSAQNAKILTDVLLAIIGPKRPVKQIYLYGLDTGMFGTGIDNMYHPVSVTSKEWHPLVVSQRGEKFITLPHRDSMVSKLYTSDPNVYYISLCRMYFDKFNTPQGIVEVKQSYDVVFEKGIEFVKNSNNRLLIFNNRGDKVFPLDSANEDFYYKVARQNPGTGTINVMNETTGQKELLKIECSEYTGFISVFILDQRQLFAPLNNLNNISALLTVAFLFVSLILSFVVTKRISSPINRMSAEIHALNLETITENASEKSDYKINEINELYDSFQVMRSKLGDSMNKLLLAQSHEMQSKMLALQSQMNPHFLYNSLSTISAMAGEGLDGEIIMMCENMSDMLRYISSDSEELVPLYEELNYTQKYLECMCIRYRGKLTYEFDVAEEIRAVKVPKLVVQLLTENAVKFGTKVRPPWKIRITGTKVNTGWRISVSDTGPGFEKEVLESISEKVYAINSTNLLPSLELEGMGLMNIYIRLQLKYKNEAVFFVSNRDCGGAEIVIGGSDE